METEKILDILEEMYPDADCELVHKDIFQLIVCVALSAQTTDKSVNRVTPALFERYPDAYALSEADPQEVAEYIKTIGMYRTKSKNIVNMAKAITQNHSGHVPSSYDDLVALPGVGRKTANVVLSVGFDKPRLAVDTHVFRVSNRIGLADEKDVLKTELALMKAIPESRWTKTHHCLIFHGRYCCHARKPSCEECMLREYCRFFREGL